MIITSAAPCLRLLVVTALLVLASTQATRPTSGNIYFYNADDSDTDEGFWKIPKNPPAQRCYSFSCHQDESSSVKWNKVQENAWLVFYDDLGCNGNYIRVFGPEGSLRPDDSGFDNRLASFMLWESGIYATRGIVDTCSGTEERSATNSSSSPGRGTNSTRGRGDDTNVSSEADITMLYDVIVGVVQPAAFSIDP